MKENFDDILKRKWEEKHFPVDQGHRADMSALLDQQDRKKPFPFWWLGGLLLVALVAGLYFTMPQTVDVQEIEPAAKEWLEAKPAKDQNAPDAVVPSTDMTDNSSTTKGQDSGYIQSSKSSSADVASESSSFTPRDNITKNFNNNQPKASTSKSSPISLVDESGSSVKANTSLQGEDLNRVDKNRADQKLADQNIVIGDDIALVDETIEVNEAMVMPRDHATLQEIDPLSIFGIDYNSNNTPGPISPKASFRPYFYGFGEAGIGLVVPANAENTSTGWNMRAGAGLGYAVSAKVELRWSGGYLYQDGGFDFERVSTVKQAGFGARSDFNTLTPDKLHYLYSKVAAQYRLRRHVVGAGGGIQWLYGAQGNIVAQIDDQLAEGPHTVSNYSWLKTDGLRNTLWTADLSYAYQLTPKIMLKVGSDFIFSSFTTTDPGLAAEGYYWNGAVSSLHPFIHVNYSFYGLR